MKSPHFFTLCLCCLVLVTLSAQAQSVSTPTSDSPTFPYPTIPEQLQSPEERGAYLARHYWDRFDFRDTALVHQPEVTEQGFSNFLDLLPRLDSLAAVRGIDVFCGRAFSTAVPEGVRTYFAELLDHYLYDPNSPMCDEEFYRVFLQRMTQSDGLATGTADIRARLTYQLECVEKNRLGTRATDFQYIDRAGHASSLYATPATDFLLLYFNDPDCERCHAVTAQLAADSLFAANPRLTVLAVYPDADTALWRSHPQPFPAAWIDAYSPDGEISERQLYVIRATPTIYLLDRHRRILLKDPTPDLLRYVLSIAPSAQSE